MPVLDLNNPRHRAAVSLVSFGSLALILFSSFGSFKAYEHMESDRFCGTSCHVRWSRSITAYSNSPHAKVGCVKCHIGSGADWFVRSKLSGSYQLYAVLLQQVSAADQDADPEPPPGAADLRAVPLAQAVLQREVGQPHVFHVG